MLSYPFQRALVLAVLAALMLLTGPSFEAAAAASADTTPSPTARVTNRTQRRVMSQVNASRQNFGRRPLGTNGLMNQRAQAWAQRLVTCQCLKHRNAPFATPSGWCAAAENVGRSGDGTLLTVHQAFMRSWVHRRNILLPRYSDIGVGVARDRDGEYFVAHAFAAFGC